MRMKSPSSAGDGHRSNIEPPNRKMTLLVAFSFILVLSLLLLGWENLDAPSVRGTTGQDQPPAHAGRYDDRQYRNRFALAPGELPGYTGWARPEQTLAGYFDMTPVSHPSPARDLQTKHHSVLNSGDRFSFLLTCNHNSTIGIDAESEPPYECPSEGGTLFYVRAYGPSVISGLVTDHRNASYSVDMQFVDPGQYTLEVVVTFSVPMEYDEFPIEEETWSEEELIEPGYEGYMVAGFPLSLQVDPPTQLSKTTEEGRKPWCTLAQLTETSPHSALYKGHWQVIDNVARLSHQPLTPDETVVSLDGYRMGLNSVGVRMRYDYEECELLHIRDIFGNGTGGVDRCLREQLGFDIPVPVVRDDLPEGANVTEGSGVGYANGTARNIESGSVSQPLDLVEDNASFEEGVHVIFIGDSVMKLVLGFFSKLVRGSLGFKVTFIETNGGIHVTMPAVTATLEEIKKREEGKNIKRAILFNTGLHDIDVLCCSKRARTRNETHVLSQGESCSSAYREAMAQLVRTIDEYPAELKAFRSTTAGWQKYGNYGFSWRANEMQPMSRSPHLADHFNDISYDIIQRQSENILITDGYWITLPRPDHTQISNRNQVGKHLVHPGFEVLSVLARRWFMLVLWGLCGDSFGECVSTIGGRASEEVSSD
ncbi:hypothetical protein ACHAXT_000550 [Thalassiosira profunda]